MTEALDSVRRLKRERDALFEALKAGESTLMIADRSQAWRDERDKLLVRISAVLSLARGEG